MGACYKVNNWKTIKKTATKQAILFQGQRKIEVSQYFVIPGTFYAWDRLPVLFGFVRESLVDGWQPFELIAPGSQKLQESDEVALAECNLVRWHQWLI